MMKQKIYVLGLVSALGIAAGIFLKVNHLAGAAIILAAGFATLVLIFLPLALINNYKSENRQNLILYIVTWITCFVVFGGMLFKILHWPGAGYILLVALPFPYVVFLPVFLIITSRNKNFNIYNTVFVLFLLVGISVLSALLSLNVSKERIYDSYDLSRSYNRMEVILNELPGIKSNTLGMQGSSSINLKIDNLLNVVDEYKNLIFSAENITKQQWINDPGVLIRPEAPALAGIAILKGNEAFPGEKLEKGIKNLILELEKSPGYENLAKAAPEIFNYKEPESPEDNWAYSVFIDNNLSWSIIYLDAIEVNLKMIKISVNTTNL
ncbi:MAG: hypothetical protein NT144_06270 [Bacteroidia bacterium]|nr:hypothetical protein [Bacteroidia bacterium]